MRLLEREPDDDLVFREFTNGDVPAYAILSHTWSDKHNEEVSFQDVEAGTGKSKAGWRKIQFCADKAAADGLRYFWIDTCCIDKKNSTELSKAINSMFRWYQKAARCYVYLTDVSAHNGKVLCHWEACFRKSRWFTRGWTLQELLAPTSVDFFSLEGEQLGSKLILEVIIHDITGIPTAALRGEPLDGFSRDERMSWASQRHTKEAEDQVYSLLGIFNISMPLVYGEGREKAYKRLQNEIDDIHRGDDADQFAVGFDLLVVPEAVKFVARENELTEMHRLLHGHTSRSAVVLHGLGGIGKTQLAIEYTTRHKEKYTAIFWLNANDEDSLKLSFRNIAQCVLEDQRDRPSTSLEILSYTSKRKNVENDRDAAALVKELDGLPLALSTAGVYLEHVTTSFSDYLRLYKASWLKLQIKSPQLSSYEDRSLYTTWQITFDRIKQENAASAQLLKLWAYFDRQDVWFELLRHAKSADDKWVQKLTEDELNFNEAVTLLCSFGLVDLDRSLQKQSGSGGYSVHSCVHSWTAFVINKEWDEGLVRLALTCVASEVPHTNEKDWWLLQQRLLQHAIRQDLFIANGKVDLDGMDWAFSNLGNLYSNLGKLAEAEKMYIRALHGGEKALGPDHPSILGTVNNLGLLYTNQGKLAEAEKMYIRALHGREEALGPDHPSTLNTVNNLGLLYTDQGKLAEAEKMYIRALHGREEALGPDHPLTLDTVNNLGNLYTDQGKLAEAEKMYIQVLHGREEALGPDHPSTLNTVNNLGNLYTDQGKLAEAEKMYIRALHGNEEALGPDHPSTLNTVNNLGNLYTDQGKLAEAEKMYIRALHGNEEALGPDHPSTLSTVNNLGNLYRDQGKLAEAEKMYIRALHGREEALGPDHPSTLNTVNNLGVLYTDQGKLAETEKMYIRALHGNEEALGPDHPSTLGTVNNLGNLYRDQGKLAEAEKMYIRALHGNKEALGPDHPSTLGTVNNLGNLYRDQGKLAEAEKINIRALHGSEEALGPDH